MTLMQHKNILLSEHDIGRPTSFTSNFPIANLKPAERNARTHSKKQIRQLADSIAQFGFGSPIVIDSDYRVVAGHGRIAAAKELGLTNAPIVTVGRRGYLAEIDPVYCGCIVRRWQSFARDDAILESTGETFDEVQAKRAAATSRAQAAE